MATPIAQRRVAGAKVEAMSILDLLTNPDHVAAARTTFGTSNEE